MSSEPVRVRFAPSPTGYLHIGGARTALFNWLMARQVPGGAFLLRIEDTDRSRHVEDSVQKILADMRWLGLGWDEGPEAGGDFGPYYQSERLHHYNDAITRLLKAGKAYYALETPEELDRLREQARAEKRTFVYPRPNPLPSIEEGERARAEGKAVVVRLIMPDRDITVKDDILGEVTLKADELEDFVIQKGDGWPTYHFACVVDDAMMKVTHVLRGQEHLMNTPKHIALQEALGVPTPHYAHLPTILNANGSKMSKRDREKALAKGEVPPEIDVRDFLVSGYLPEALLNFLSLLGWSSGQEEERLTLEETTERFRITDVNKSNARFDRDKLLAFNTEWAARLPKERLLVAFKDFLAANDHPLAQQPDNVLAQILDACAGFRTFVDVLTKAGFIFVNDEAIEYQEKPVKKVLQKNENAGFVMLERMQPRLEELAEWTADAIENLLEKVCTEEDVKLGAVAQPLRVAVSGNSISPGIGLTLELLGKTSTLRRIQRALELKNQQKETA